MTSDSTLLFVSVSIAAVSLACATPSNEKVAAAGTPPVVATIVRAQTAQLPSRFEAGGLLRARFTSSLAARVMAPVVEVRVRVGDRVKRGQTLVVLDGRELGAQADRAGAALAAAQQAVRGADSDRQGADAGLTLATATHARMSALHATRSATAQELDEAVAALGAATARAEGAAAHQAEATSGLKAAGAAADAAAIALSYATIAAPFDGLISERLIDPGSLATPGAPLLTLEDTSSFSLDLRLDEARARTVTVGQTVDVRLDDEDADGAWSAGRVSEISRLDPTGHGFLAKIDVGASPSFRSGAFGRARIAGASRPALAAPESAVVRRGQMTFVFAVDADGLARLRPITAGASAGGQIELLAGVAEGEPLVANPPPLLTDGTRVTGDRR